jgi:hypothetical protein
MTGPPDKARGIMTEVKRIFFASFLFIMINNNTSSERQPVLTGGQIVKWSSKSRRASQEGREAGDGTDSTGILNRITIAIIRSGDINMDLFGKGQRKEKVVQAITALGVEKSMCQVVPGFRIRCGIFMKLRMQ